MQSSERPKHPGEKAFAARDKAVAFAMKRKEDYLGARVPKELKDRVSHTADTLGIPVSLLIRRVLEEVFTRQTGVDSVIESIQKSVAPVIDVKGVESKFAAVVGWNAIEMNKRRPCERCGTPIGIGESAVVGMTGQGQRDIIVCTRCKDHLQAQ